MAPELLFPSESSQPVQTTKEADIYALSMVVLEVSDIYGSVYSLGSSVRRDVFIACSLCWPRYGIKSITQLCQNFSDIERERTFFLCAPWYDYHVEGAGWRKARTIKLPTEYLHKQHVGTCSWLLGPSSREQASHKNRCGAFRNYVIDSPIPSHVVALTCALMLCNRFEFSNQFFY